MERFLGFMFVLGSAGTLAELILLEHTEGYWQKLPLVLLASGIVAVVVLAWKRRAAIRRLVSAMMALLVVSGAIGIYQHYRGNLEFELEMNASRHGWELVWETLGGATPTLAPGMMTYLGLLGFAYSRLASRNAPKT